MRGETRGRTRPYLEAEGNRIAGRGRAARAPLDSEDDRAGHPYPEVGKGSLRS